VASAFLEERLTPEPHSDALPEGQPETGTTPVTPSVDTRIDSSFAEVVKLIERAHQRAYQAVNTELVGLYWQIGGYISVKLAAAEWGEGVVERLAAHLARTLPGQRGFTRRNLFRMRQFFETYNGDEKVSALLTQLGSSQKTENKAR
jgi:hypothetical protein